MSFHPYSCALRHNPTAVIVGKWLLNTLGFVQWVVSVHLWKASSGTQSAYSTYDCLASQISAAPGTSTCSVEQICARDLLFRSYNFAFSNEGVDVTDPKHAMFVAFMVLSFGTIGRFLFLGLLPVVYIPRGTRTLPELRAKIDENDSGFLISLALSSMACIIVGGFTTAGAIMSFRRGREGAFVIDWTCQTVHVNLSAWRYYLDVEYELPLRAVKMWFNV